MMQWLYDVGAACEVCLKDEEGATLLMWACYKGHLHVAKWLFEVGAAEDIRTPNIRGWTPMMAACHGGHLHIMSWLHERGAAGDISMPASDGQTLWSKACQADRVDMVRWLVLRGAAADDQGHICPVRLSELGVGTRELLTTSLATELSEHALLTRLILCGVSAPCGSGSVSPAHRSALRLLQGHESTILRRITQFVGIVVGRQLRSVREVIGLTTLKKILAKGLAKESFEA
jgi:hypothetical protein